jgi:hypothetical protein
VAAAARGSRPCGVPEVGLGVTCRDRQPGMIAAMALRLLYLIFSRLLDSLTLLGRASASKNIELLVPAPNVAVTSSAMPATSWDPWAPPSISA